MPDTACDAIPPLTTVREAFATSGWSLDFVFDHHPLLQHYDVYEAYLLDALTGAKTNHRRITPGVVSFLFFVADPVKLRRHSDPLPDPLLRSSTGAWPEAATGALVDEQSGLCLLLCPPFPVAGPRDLSRAPQPLPRLRLYPGATRRGMAPGAFRTPQAPPDAAHPR
jgi:hypothetical protein